MFASCGGSHGIGDTEAWIRSAASLLSVGDAASVSVLFPDRFHLLPSRYSKLFAHSNRADSLAGLL